MAGMRTQDMQVVYGHMMFEYGWIPLDWEDRKNLALISWFLTEQCVRAYRPSCVCGGQFLARFVDVGLLMINNSTVITRVG